MTNAWIRPSLSRDEQDELARKESLAQTALQAAYAEFPSLVFATSLGAEDMVLTDMIARFCPSIRLITLDTGRLPQETYTLLDQVQQTYARLQWSVLSPNPQDLEPFVNANGINAFYRDITLRQSCCELRKIRPLRRALAQADAWITGLRSAQSATRQHLPEREHDALFDLPKFNPLTHWHEREIWAYLQMYQVPYNALHEQFYPSIGCAPCTRAVTPGENIRSGRWWWENPETKECGLHRK